jgi:hypothetical protein
MNARDELIEILHQEATADRVKNSPLRDVPVVAAKLESAVDAILAAGYRRPRIINSADELLALPEASVVLDYEGDVSQKRDGLWCGYETAPLNSNKLARIAGPFTVLHEPEADQ